MSRERRLGDEDSFCDTDSENCLDFDNVASQILILYLNYKLSKMKLQRSRFYNTNSSWNQSWQPLPRQTIVLLKPYYFNEIKKQAAYEKPTKKATLHDFALKKDSRVECRTAGVYGKQMPGSWCSRAWHSHTVLLLPVLTRTNRCFSKQLVWCMKCLSFNYLDLPTTGVHTWNYTNTKNHISKIRQSMNSNDNAHTKNVPRNNPEHNQISLQWWTSWMKLIAPWQWQSIFVWLTKCTLLKHRIRWRDATPTNHSSGCNSYWVAFLAFCMKQKRKLAKKIVSCMESHI